MGRFRQGLRCAAVAGDVVRANPRLVAFPVVALLGEAAIAVGYVFGVAGGADLLKRNGFVLAVWFLPVSFVSSVLSTWAAAFMVAAADRHFAGEPPTMSAVWAQVRRRWRPLLAWSLLAATVGAVLAVAQERLGAVGRWVVSVTGVVWSLASLLAVPIIVTEETGSVPALRRSTNLVRQRWGETISADVGIGLVVFVCALPVLLLSCLAFTVGTAVGVTVVLALFLSLEAVSEAVFAVFSLALYRYAADGVIPDTYTSAELTALVTARPARGGGLTAVDR